MTDSDVCVHEYWVSVISETVSPSV